MYRARYRLPLSLVSRVTGKRIAIVDDVMSAGSALRGTYLELEAHGAQPIVAGALLILGTTGVDYFVEQGIAVEAAARSDYELWQPTECPQCAAGILLENVASAHA